MDLEGRRLPESECQVSEDRKENEGSIGRMVGEPSNELPSMSGTMGRELPFIYRVEHKVSCQFHPRRPRGTAGFRAFVQRVRPRPILTSPPRSEA